jgi:hypothetical protein
MANARLDPELLRDGVVLIATRERLKWSLGADWRHRFREAGRAR